MYPVAPVRPITGNLFSSFSLFPPRFPPPHLLALRQVVDLARKLFLTALILFVDTEVGDSKLLRLVIAVIVTAMYLALLALARPFKRPEDLYLACTSNLLLACCFVSGIAIKLCEQGAWLPVTCHAFLGLSTAYDTNVFVIVLTVVMLVVALLVIALRSFTAITTPSIRLASSGREPFLELPVNCNFHCFLSHAWRTGQDQTHTIARQLQLLLPAIRIWLDVDCLEDVGKLEQSVAESACFVIFLSEGYFRSANCRRELYAALATDRPIVAVREADKAKGGATVEELQQECRECCVEVAPKGYAQYRGPSEVLQRVFAEEPIVWVSAKTSALELTTFTPRFAVALGIARDSSQD
eukprot:88046-Rhodomonas_salina.2